MFELFTVTARLALFFARHEAGEMGGTSIEAEHMLLGLLRADRGPTPHAFAVADLSYADARVRIRAQCGVQPQVPDSVDLPISDQTERILQYATEEADRLDDKYVGAGHLLLGVLREDGSFAAGMLRAHGMTIENVREHVVKPAAVPEPEPEAPGEVSGLWLKREALDAVVSLERIRYLAEEIGRSRTQGEDTRGLVDEIHHHLDALKRHLA